MKLSLANTPKSADLTGMSNRNIAKIATAVLEDIMKLVSADEQGKVIDKNKIRREVKRNRNQIKEEQLSGLKSIDSIYFDGRKDQTMTQQEGRRVVVAEEYIALIEEPESKYLEHVSLVPPVTATDVVKGLMCFIKDNNIDTTKLTVIGCHGTNVNTGWKGGVIRLLETQLNKPLQWSICLLHANELPLRHLLQNLDGDTKGPNSLSGPIGSLLADCEKAPIVDFLPIESELI